MSPKERGGTQLSVLIVQLVQFVQGTGKRGVGFEFVVAHLVS